MRKRGLFLLLCFLGPGCAANQIPPVLDSVRDSSQVLIVEQLTPKNHRARLSAWEQENGHWRNIYNACVVLGRNGLAPKDEKKEGDGHTPSGIFSIGTAFGYAGTLTTGLNYRQASAKDVWVDDPISSQYNQWVHGTPDASSFERMKREDGLYRMGAVIEYNTHPIIAGKGSAIFLHIWRRYDKATAGCVAASQRSVRRILKRLNKDKHPIIILQHAVVN